MSGRHAYTREQVPTPRTISPSSGQHCLPTDTAIGVVHNIPTYGGIMNGAYGTNEGGTELMNQAKKRFLWISHEMEVTKYVDLHNAKNNIPTAG